MQLSRICYSLLIAAICYDPRCGVWDSVQDAAFDPEFRVEEWSQHMRPGPPSRVRVTQDSGAEVTCGPTRLTVESPVVCTELAQKSSSICKVNIGEMPASIDTTSYLNA